METVVAVTKALADESRLRILLALRAGELCVCQLVELLQLAPSTVSKHMAILRQARLVRSRKEGRWVYYRLAGREAPAAVCGALRWVARFSGESEQAEADRRRLGKILRMDKELLCKTAVEN